MKTEWENIEAFRRHLIKMEEFRHTHRHNRCSVSIAHNDIPLPCKTRQQNCDQNDIGLFTTRGKPVVVPIWKIEPAEDSQN
jgi:hypothetical protein